jgi:hypothetical protein
MKVNDTSALTIPPCGCPADSCRRARARFRLVSTRFRLLANPVASTRFNFIGVVSSFLALLLVTGCNPSTLVDISQNATVSVKTKNGTIIVHDDGSTEQVNDEGLPPPTNYVKADGTVLPLAFDNAFPFQDGFAVVEKDGRYGFINTKGDLVIKPQFDGASGFSEHLAAVKVEEKYGYIDEHGHFIIQPKFKEAWDFCEGLAAVKIDDKYGYIDKSGQPVIEPKFEWTGGFTKDKLATVMVDGKYGFIDKKGKLVIPAIFENAEDFSEGFATVRKTDEGKTSTSTTAE